MKKLAGLTLLMFAPLMLTSQQTTVPPAMPHLYHIWSDGKGITHLEEIKLLNNTRARIEGVSVNFPGMPVPGGGPQMHRSVLRQLAITVSGQIDVEAGDGTKAHLNVGDMAFLEDLTGQGHKTLAAGAASVYLRVPDNFDVRKWAAGQ
jgi:hypothetical protein